jgi:hypothetical protein
MTNRGRALVGWRFCWKESQEGLIGLAKAMGFGEVITERGGLFKKTQRGD